jgi:hypothetical protein
MVIWLYQRIQLEQKIHCFKDIDLLLRFIIFITAFELLLLGNKVLETYFLNKAENSDTSDGTAGGSELTDKNTQTNDRQGLPDIQDTRGGD